MKLNYKISAVFLVLCLVPLIAVSLVAYSSARNTITNQILNQLESISDVQGHRTQIIIENNLEKIATLSSRTQLLTDLANYNNSGDIALQQTMNANLQDALSSIITFEEISVLNTSGEIVASTEGSRIGEFHSGEEFFTRGLTENSADILFLDEEGRLMVYVSGPMYKDGILLGVVKAKATSYDLIFITQDYSGLGDTGETLLARRNQDGDATFIVPLRFDPDAVLKTTISKDLIEVPITQALLKNESVFTDSKDYRGEPVLASTRYIPSADWGLVAKIDVAEAYSPLNNLRNVMVIDVNPVKLEEIRPRIRYSFSLV